MLNRIYLTIIVFLFAGLSSCDIETARPFKKQFLIIASDCLESKDTLLFQSFKVNKRIRIRILPMTADSLKRRLALEGLNTEIDAIFLSSIYDMVRIEKADKLQDIPKEKLPLNFPSKYHSRNFKWFGIGCDPYVIVTLNDTIQKTRTYSDLAERTKWCTDLTSNADFFPFYSAIVHRINSKKQYNAHDWIKHFLKNKVGVLSDVDSTTMCSTLFTKYSTFRNSEIIANSKFSKGIMIYPNQRTGGTYFSMPTFAIIKQARNYSNALDFLNYICMETVNKRLNYTWNTFPVINSRESSFTYQNTRFKKFSASPVRLTSYYDRVNNIINLID